MKAEELRIGNMLSIPRLERVLTVSAIFKTHFVCEDKDGIRFEESIRINYQPIPLTEEWLMKFGCQRNRSGWFISADYFLYNPLTYLDVPSSKYYGLMYNDKYITPKAVEYVHQLQNLYFALTGEELTLKDNL